MPSTDKNFAKYGDLSAADLKLQLAVHTKNLIDMKMSHVSVKHRGEASMQRRQIARLLTRLRNINEQNL